MTKEKLIEIINGLHYQCQFNFNAHLMDAMDKFFDSNVVIPKGENRHPSSDVLHLAIEGIKIQGWNHTKNEWEDDISWFIDKNDLDYPTKYRIKPQEPVDNKNTDDIELKENNFEDYGFLDPVFNGHIVGKESDTYLIGYYVEHYNIFTFPQKIPCFWNIQTGNCYKGGGCSNSKYSLTLKPSEPVYEYQWMLWINSAKKYCKGATHKFYVSEDECKESIATFYYIEKIESTKRERK